MMKRAYEYPSELREQVCQRCHKSYNAKWLLIVDQWRDASIGFCDDCKLIWREEQRIKDDEELRKANSVKAQAEMITRRRIYRENNSGIPLYYQPKDFSNIRTNVKGNMKKVYPECVKYAEEYPLDYRAHLKSEGKPYPSFCLASPEVWGVGKTHLACAILHRVLDRWQGIPNFCPVYFTTEPDIYLRIQNTYSFSNDERKVRESETDIIQQLINVPLLVVDDIGKQRRTDMKFVQRTLYSIINGRYDAMKPIILTANMGLEQLERYLGANDSTEYERASFDRLLEMCKGNFWLLEGESQRGK